MSGKEVVRIFEKYGCEVLRTVGSHVRIKIDGDSRHITIPLHKELKKGTLRGIIKDFEISFGADLADKEFYTTN